MTPNGVPVQPASLQLPWEDFFAIPGREVMSRPPSEERVKWFQRSDYRKALAEARRREERREPLDWWEYEISRPDQQGIQATQARPTIEAPSWYMPAAQPLPMLGGEDWPGYKFGAVETDLDWYLWSLEEIKYGLDKWRTDIGATVEDAHLTVRSQKEKASWRGIIEPIKHAVLGGTASVMSVVGPPLNQLQYLTERGIGWAKRGKDVPVEPFDPDKWLNRQDYSENVERQSINSWLEEEYGDDPRQLAKAKLVARDVDRVSYSWGLSGGDVLEKFKKIHTRLMQEGKTPEDVERILREEQKFVPEILFGFVLDPLNIVQWTGAKPLQTAQSSKIARLTSAPVDDTLDLATITNKLGLRFRTPATKARKIGEITSDYMSVLLTRAENTDDIPRVINDFVGEAAYDSIHGQAVKRIIGDMEMDDILKGLDKAEDLASARSTVVGNLTKAAYNAELDMVRNTRKGRVLEAMSRRARAVSRKEKQILSRFFLGENLQYTIANIVDNMTNIFARIGWGKIPDAGVTDYLGISTNAAESFFVDTVGFTPNRFKYGFSRTPAEISGDVAEVTEEASKVATALKTVWDWVKTGPTLKAAGKTEGNMSALAVTHSYIRRWGRNWNNNLPTLPADLLDEVAAGSPRLADALQAVGLGKYKFADVLDELAAIENVVVEGAETQGRVYSVGFYLQQLTKDERAALQAHPDLMAEINKLNGVTSEAERRGVIDGLRSLINEGLEAVAKQKHVNDLQTVGWGHRGAESIRATEPVTRRFSDNPLVFEAISEELHDFDLLRRVADTFGVDVQDLFEPMDEAVFQLIKDDAAPWELWEYYTETYPFMSKYYPDVEIREGVLRVVGEDELVDTMETLTHFDEVTPARARDAFFDLYKRLMPQARKAMMDDIPEVKAIRTVPSSYAEDAIVETIGRMKDWMARRPDAVADDYDELQRAVNLAKRYMWYKVNQEEWVSWANSSWKIDRLPDTNPSLYDIYRRYKAPIESAIDKLDQRSFRDLDPSMEISPDLWQRVMNYFNTDYRRELEITQYATARQALADRDYALLDYGDKTYFDVLFSIPVPYEFWTTRSIWNWAKFTIDNPGIMSKLTRYQAQMEAQTEKDPLLPTRLKGWFPIGIQGAINLLSDKAWTAETERYIKPERIITPLETMSLWGDTYMPDNYQDIPRGREWVFFNNMWSTSPILFDSAAIAANRILPWLEENQPAVAEKVKRYIPSEAVSVGTDYWSGSRGLRGLSIVAEPLLNRMGINVPPEGLNPEGTIHDWLGLSRVPTSEEYWRYQWLANLAGTGEITSEEAAAAFRDKSGKAWDLAVRKAAEQQAIPSFIRWSTYLPVKEFPSEERIMRGMAALYREAYERYEKGDRDALKEFYAVYPDYRFRQLAFRYWDVSSGKMTEEDWDDWTQLNLTVNQYYNERAQLDKEREHYLGIYLPGTPEHYRVMRDFGARLRELSDKYDEPLTEYFEYLADNRRKFIQWRDGPKAQAMREWLDRWYKADPNGKQKMLDNLPQTMLEAATVAKSRVEPRGVFTALEARQEIALRDQPVDAVYRELNNQAARIWDVYYEDWWRDNAQAEVQDMYAAYLEMDFPTNLEYRETHPELDKALARYEVWRESLLDTILDPASDNFIANIQVLHPDWDDEKIAEVRSIGESIGSFKTSDYTYIKGSDRDMVISELWRFWTALPANSLARKRAKEILGPRFGELFLGGEYNQVSDTELALWLNLLPADWQSLIPEGRRPPFGEGPTPMTDEERKWASRALTADEWKEMFGSLEWIPSEPEDREQYEFAPSARPEETITEEQAREEAQAALSGAREQLRSGEAIDKIELPSPAEELQYQTAYGLLQRALEGESDLWNDPLLMKWFPANSPSRRFWQFYYGSVPPGELGAWAKEHSLISAVLDKVSRKYVTEDAYRDALTFLIEELPKHDIGDPREYEQARAEAEQYYALVTPALEHLRDVYFSLPSGRGQRKQFLEDYPQLLALFDAQNAFKAAHPVFTKYYDPDWVERAEARGYGGGAGASGYTYRGVSTGGKATSGISWKALVASAGPLVMGELLSYWTGKGQLSSSARIHLRKIWTKSGAGMDFDDWLDYLKRLWLYVGTSSFKAPTPPKIHIPGIGSGTLRSTGGARWRVNR